MNNILLLKFVEIFLQSCHYFMSLKYSNTNNKKLKLYLASPNSLCGIGQ
jgi:hypothetical protein